MNAQFKQFKEQQLANQPLTKTVALSQIKILNESTLDVGGMALPTTSEAIKDLVKILNIPIRFSKEISRTYGQTALQQLIELQKTTRIVADKKTSVTLVADPVSKKIVQVSSENNILPYEKFFDIFERIMNTHDLEITSMFAGPKGICISALSKQNEFQIDNFKNEVFQPGFTFINDVKQGTSVDSHLHRLVCANGLIARQFNHSIIYNPEDQNDFFEKLVAMSKIGYIPRGFQDKVKQAMHTKASFAELEQVASLMVNSQITHKQLDRFIPYNEVVNKFAHKGVDVFKLNKKQKENAITNIPVWNIINGLTDFASHDYGFKISAESKINMQISAGNMLAKEFDASNIITVAL